MPRPRYCRSRAPRRRSIWRDAIINQSVVTGGQVSTDLTGALTQFQKQGLTLVRTIVHFTARVQTLGLVIGSQQLGMGIAIVDEDANAAGALPEVLTQGDFPVKGWIWRDIQQLNDHTSAGSTESKQIIDVEAELKSRRRIDDTDLLIIFENQDLLGGTFTIDIDGLVRSLFLLP